MKSNRNLSKDSIVGETSHCYDVVGFVEKWADIQIGGIFSRILDQGSQSLVASEDITGGTELEQAANAPVPVTGEQPDSGLRALLQGVTAFPQSSDEPNLPQSLLDQINDAIVVLTPDFHVLYCNASAERLFGWPSHEAMGKRYRAIAGTQVSNVTRSAIHQEILSRGSWNGEIICTNRTGRRFLVHVSWSVLRDRAGRIGRVLGIHRDVVAPKQMEQALRESEDRLELVHSTIALGTWEADVQNERIRCSDEQLRLYGISGPRAPFTLQEWLEIVHPDDRAPLEEMRLNLATIGSFERQVRVIWPDGSVHWLHSKSRLISQPGEPRRFIGADYDITEQKNTEQRLRNQSAELENSSRIVHLEKTLLELVARGTPLQRLLEELTKSIEEMSPDCVCSIMLLDAEGSSLSAAAGPSLPPAYMGALKNLKVGPNMGACGSAAFHNETVIVEDIATDARFAGGRDFVTSFGFRACWSVPIRNFNQAVLGTFAMYHYSPGQPQPADLRLVEAGARLAGNVIEWRRSEERLRETSQRLEMAEKAAGFGIWEVDIPKGLVSFSEGFASLLGLPLGRIESPFSELEAMLHPKDRALVLSEAEKASQTGAFQAEFRIVLPDGSVRWHRSQGRVEKKEGVAVRATGALIDITEQKKADDNLRILSSAVEQSPVSILIANLNQQIEYVNSRLTEMTGFTLEELKGQHPGRLSAESFPRGSGPGAEVMKEGQWHGVLRSVRKNAEPFWASTTLRLIRDKEGNPTHVLSLAEDITARLEMESALKLSEERFRIAAESAGDTIYEWDIGADRVTVLGNHQFRMEDHRPEGVPHSRIFLEEIVHPEDRARVTAAVQHTLRTGEPFNEEFRILTSDGRELFFSNRGAVLRDGEGAACKWIGACRDITELKRVERANAQLASIVENTEAAVISMDLNDDVITWNGGAEKLYGYSAREMIGQPVVSIVPPEKKAEYTSFLERLRAGESIKHVETVRIRKSGERVPVFLTMSPMWDSHGRCLGVAKVSEDITHIKELERQLAQTQKLESIGQLAAGIAHEINTPIQYIGDNGKFLEDAFRDLLAFADARHTPEAVPAIQQNAEDGALDYLRGEVPKAIEQLLSGVDHVAGIVRAMKDFSHPGPVEKTPTDINHAIENTALVSRNEWKYVAELTTELDPDLPVVPCFGGEFNQVVLNLIINAAHAIAEVHKDSGRLGRIHITTRQAGEFAEILVSDTGCGIPKAIQAKVFDPFFTTKPVGKGTGQGLAIAHSVIVQRHGGSVRLESEPGKGTTFIIRLPIGAEQAWAA